MKTADRALHLYKALKRAHPDARCALLHKNALELLVATILSAQCTDVRVNKVTPALFKKYRTAADYGKTDIKTLETEIRSTGFYRQKAKAIKSIGNTLAEKFGGRVPKTMEDLTALPGVWRKTANVVLGNMYGIPGVVVDTHVKRLSYRMGLTAQNDPDRIETDLMKFLPEKTWILFSHLLIFHGRRICKAAKPACPACPVKRLCPKIGVAAHIKKQAAV